MRSIATGAALAGACLLAACGKSDGGNDAAKGSGASPTSTATTPASSTGPTASASAPAAPDASSAAGASPSVSSTGPAPTASSSGGNSTAATGNATATAGNGTTSASSGNAAGMGAAAGDAASGQKVFASACVACHGAGVAGAPKLGDKADWGPRIAQGNDTLYQHAIQGYQGRKGVMPAKGGQMQLPDPDVKAAVDYMVAQGR
jgi:cytochrome c5